MKILAVDSSSATASVALVDNKKIVAEYFINAGLTHSQTLAPMIESIFKNLKIDPAEIDLYVSTSGPGSFTGLRIGMATVEAMALANDKPCAGVSSLEALSYNINNHNNVICACMDARREQVYNALFKFENNKLVRLTEDRAILIKDLSEELKNLNFNIEIVGDAAEICYNSTELESLGNKCILLPAKDRYIKASNVALAVLETFNSNNSSANKFDLKVNYIKVPQAQRVMEEKLSNG